MDSTWLAMGLRFSPPSIFWHVPPQPDLPRASAPLSPSALCPVLGLRFRLVKPQGFGIMVVSTVRIASSFAMKCTKTVRGGAWWPWRSVGALARHVGPGHPCSTQLQTHVHALT